MRRIARLLAAAAGMVIMAGAHAAWAAPEAAGPYTLREAVMAALEDNPRLKAMQSGLDASTEGVGEARSHLMPKLTVEERYMRTTNPTYAFMSKLNQANITAADFSPTLLNEPDAMGDWQTSVSIEQAVFARPAMIGLSMARAGVEVARLEYERARDAVALDVIRAYLRVKTAQGYMEAARQGLADAEEHHRVALTRERSGLGQHSDVLRTDVSVKEGQEGLSKATKALELARRSLGLMIGLDGPADVETGEPVDLDAMIGSRTLDEYLSARSGRADLEAMRGRVNIARKSLDMEGSRHWPVVGVGATYQANAEDAPFGSDGDGYMLMAFMRWEIYDGGQTIAARARARHQVTEAEHYLDGLERESEYRVHEAYLELEEARRGFDLARARLALADEVRRIMVTRFENSLASVVELLDSQSALNSARAAVVEERNLVRIAEAELLHASGILVSSCTNAPHTEEAIQ
jgi:outer membrane protein TolC